MKSVEKMNKTKMFIHYLSIKYLEIPTANTLRMTSQRNIAVKQ